jgi:hypothetical protein
MHQAQQGMAQASQEISTYSGVQAWLANPLRVMADTSMGTTAFVTAPQSSIPQAAQGIVQLPGNISQNFGNFAQNPSVYNGFNLVENGLQVWGLYEGGTALYNKGASYISGNTAPPDVAPTPTAPAPTPTPAPSPTSGSFSSQFGTQPNQAYFWSGLGRQGPNVAANIATGAGGTTLETLIESRGVQMPTWNAADATSVQIWDQASAAYAQGASGTVRVVLGDNVSSMSTWQTVEFPALKANQNVTSVIQVNPTTGAETVIFHR